jgi:hypothetical protein
VELRKLVLVVINKFSNNKSWRFVTKKHVFTNPTNPWSVPFPETAFVAFSGPQMNNDFVGMKIGDLNGNANTNNFSSANGRESNSNVNLQIQNTTFEKGDLVKVPITFNGNIDLAACQFTFAFDNKVLDFQGFEKGNMEGVDADMFNFKNLSDGQIAAAWFNPNEVNQFLNPTLCYFTFRAKTNGNLAKAINLNSTLTTSEYYNSEGKAFNLAFDFNQKDSEDSFELFQNQPNPYTQQTTIAFKLPEESNVKLSIFDASGKNIKVIEQLYSKGYQQITISKDDLNNHTGVLFYRLDAGKHSSVRKMIVLP